MKGVRDVKTVSGDINKRIACSGTCVMALEPFHSSNHQNKANSLQDSPQNGQHIESSLDHHLRISSISNWTIAHAEAQ